MSDFACFALEVADASASSGVGPASADGTGLGLGIGLLLSLFSSLLLTLVSSLELELDVTFSAELLFFVTSTTDCVTILDDLDDSSVEVVTEGVELLANVVVFVTEGVDDPQPLFLPPWRFTNTAVISCPPFSFRNELVLTNFGTFLPTPSPAPKAFAAPVAAAPLPTTPKPRLLLLLLLLVAFLFVPTPPAAAALNDPTPDVVDALLAFDDEDFNFVNAPRC
mmetsp:Transcript_4560/g.6685  ORF Transcript_4560/g.6685 Transcript_4560/m.6685 type:complete len:223 (+) Transcript_4560:3571-4239(+)